MRTGLDIVAALLVLTGIVWSLQGAGTLGGSFMTGDRLWLWIGVACVVVGAAILAMRRRPRG